MAILNTQDVMDIIKADDLDHKGMVLSATVRGDYSQINGTVSPSGSITSVINKLKDRFDNPTYYT